ncbi:translesion DNA synthesis-associated protein ImuA [Luteimonas sp. e5]
MARAASLSHLIDARQVWRGPARAPEVPTGQPTGHAELDARLPWGGWPPASLSEILMPADGVGELSLVMPTLARLTRAGQRIVLIAPPYRVHAPGWRNGGVDLAQIEVVQAATGKDALWAAEQCLRSAACAAVLCWPMKADDRALRRLQVAAETGQSLGFVFRDARQARNPSPAALRLQISATARQITVLKCRGGWASTEPMAFDRPWH